MTPERSPGGDNETRDQLAADMLRAHAACDSIALVDFYAEAARLACDLGDADRAGFYLTHAWIFALESNHPNTDALRAALAAEGRVD